MNTLTNSRGKMNEQILTSHQIAERYGISPETLKVWRWRLNRGEAGYPRFIKLGRCVRYRVADFEAWIQHNRKEYSDLEETER